MVYVFTPSDPRDCCAAVTIPDPNKHYLPMSRTRWTRCGHMSVDFSFRSIVLLSRSICFDIRLPAPLNIARRYLLGVWILINGKESVLEVFYRQI